MPPPPPPPKPPPAPGPPPPNPPPPRSPPNRPHAPTARPPAAAPRHRPAGAGAVGRSAPGRPTAGWRGSRPASQAGTRAARKVSRRQHEPAQPLPVHEDQHEQGGQEEDGLQLEGEGQAEEPRRPARSAGAAGGRGCPGRARRRRSRTAPTRRCSASPWAAGTSPRTRPPAASAMPGRTSRTIRYGEDGQQRRRRRSRRLDPDQRVDRQVGQDGEQREVGRVVVRERVGQPREPAGLDEVVVPGQQERPVVPGLLGEHRHPRRETGDQQDREHDGDAPRGGPLRAGTRGPGGWSPGRRRRSGRGRRSSARLAFTSWCGARPAGRTPHPRPARCASAEAGLWTPRRSRASPWDDRPMSANDSPGVLLDVDGTLLDTNYLHALAWWQAFRDAGVAGVTMADTHRAVGIASEGWSTGSPRRPTRRRRRRSSSGTQALRQAAGPGRRVLGRGPPRPPLPRRRLPRRAGHERGEERPGLDAAGDRGRRGRAGRGDHLGRRRRGQAGPGPDDHRDAAARPRPRPDGRDRRHGLGRAGRAARGRADHQPHLRRDLRTASSTAAGADEVFDGPADLVDRWDDSLLARLA